MLSELFEKIGDWIAYVFMPLVTCYHLLCGNIFLNTAAYDATGLEQAGNIILAPFQYLFAGEVALASKHAELPYDFQQRFDYHELMGIRTAASITTLPFSLFLGTVLKAASYTSSEVRERHQRLAYARSAPRVISNMQKYTEQGLKLEQNEPETILPLNYPRRPGDELHLEEAKEALREICRLLKENDVPFWADCGTCLGAYRYGGVIPWDADIDIAVLQPDFKNVKRLLSHLDQEKYLVEDWSNRHFPETYLKVYLRKTRNYIDIYHYAIDTEQNTVHYILSNAESIFMPTSWKISEKRFTVPTPFDVVFPLKRAVFDGIEIPVPNDIERYLQLRYGTNLTPAKVYDPVSKQYIKDLSHPYWQQAYAR